MLGVGARAKVTTWLRHQVTSAVATAADYSLYTALVFGAAAPPHMAVLPSAAAGGTVHFLLVRGFVFRDARPDRLSMQAIRYAASCAATAAANAFVVALLASALGALPARVVASTVGALAVSWPLHRYWVFPPQAGTGVRS